MRYAVFERFDTILYSQLEHNKGDEIILLHELDPWAVWLWVNNGDDMLRYVSIEEWRRSHEVLGVNVH